MTDTRTHLAYQVSLTLGDYPDDFDIDGIVDEIRELSGATDVDQVEPQTYWAIVERHQTN